jgi:hypothetical protein
LGHTIPKCIGRSQYIRFHPSISRHISRWAKVIPNIEGRIARKENPKPKSDPTSTVQNHAIDYLFLD